MADSLSFIERTALQAPHEQLAENLGRGRSCHLQPSQPPARGSRLRVLALSLNEGILVEKLRAAGITIHVIPEARHSFAGIRSTAAQLLKTLPTAAIHSHRYKENPLARPRFSSVAY